MIGIANARKKEGRKGGGNPPKSNGPYKKGRKGGGRHSLRQSWHAKKGKEKGIGGIVQLAVKSKKPPKPTQSQLFRRSCEERKEYLRRSTASILISIEEERGGKEKEGA